MVTTAPTGVAFTTLAVTMLLYALPSKSTQILRSAILKMRYLGAVALINAELAVAIPKDGGLVVWVQEAFGVTLGGHNAWCDVSSSMALVALQVFAGGSGTRIFLTRPSIRSWQLATS